MSFRIASSLADSAATLIIGKGPQNQKHRNEEENRELSYCTTLLKLLACKNT